MMAAVVVGWAAGCRDEQAGPRPRAPRPPPAVAQAQPGPTGSPQVLDALPGPLSFPSGSTWANGAVTYLGSILTPAAPLPGQPLTIRHFFRADGAQPQGFHFFTHVVDPTSGQQVGNLDHELQQGNAPLGTWPAGKIIEDRQDLQMPNYPGVLELRLGFWNDAGRLAPDGAARQDDRQRMLGPRLEGPQAKLPEYHAIRASKPLTIDGLLDDEAWKGAEAVPLVTSFDGRPTRVKTTFRLVYDDEYLYAAFDAEDRDVWGTLKNKDDAIYNEDVVEVFFDADGDGKTYNELQVSPHNVNFDASFVTMRSDLEVAKKWESGMTTAVHVRGTLDDDRPDEGWSAEMKIPLKNLTAVPHVPVQKGEVWRFNAYRLEHFEHYKDIEGQAFSPLFKGDFHHLPRFGRLVFQ